MSHGPSTVEAVEPTKPSDPERLPIGKILAVATIAAVVFGLSVLWAERTLRAESRTTEPALIPPEVGRSQIGMVNQRLFELHQEAIKKRAEQERRLNSYGWVDRDKQIIHLPIERAMEQMAAESEP